MKKKKKKNSLHSNKSHSNQLPNVSQQIYKYAYAVITTAFAITPQLTGFAFPLVTLSFSPPLSRKLKATIK
jgi:hypothetical protein